ncbi:MAG: pantoate--beta-alanine ligase [Planctomycetota bacterium]|nr:MAG: pantoate--beta-alanine ligase [Planctomycetota bacterium]
MRILTCCSEAYAQVDHLRRQGARVGFVPTMGALHEGHLSLVRRSREDCDATVVSIFVNPTQFGPHEDFSRYPRTFESDCAALRDLGVDFVFAPSAEELYPAGFSTYVQPPKVAERLEGKCRPGHFRGVATVVLKLFHIIPATAAYFGQKDYQQLLVIQHMVDDLNVPIRVVGCPIVREPDGLAMSSRNRYLSQAEREAALSLWKALTAAQSALSSGQRDARELEQLMQTTLYTQGADRIDYAVVADPASLEPVSQVDRPAIALVAAHVGKTRLIDNLLLQP